MRCVALLVEERGEGTLAGRRHHHPPPAIFQKRVMLVIPPTHYQSFTMTSESNKAKTGGYGTLWRQITLIRVTLGCGEIVDLRSSETSHTHKTVDAAARRTHPLRSCSPRLDIHMVWPRGGG